MKIKNLKIGTQLKLGFAAMLFFVVVMGVMSYLQSDKLHEQTEYLYEHPIQVRRAIGDLEINILNMRIGSRDLMLADNEQERHEATQLIELSTAIALQQFTILDKQYLGPHSDIDDAYQAFVKWKTAREELNTLSLSQEKNQLLESASPGGRVGNLRDNLLVSIHKIDDFARSKADDLYADSQDLNNMLNKQLLFLVAAILLLSLLINYILLRNIRKPLQELTNAANQFHDGDLDARSLYESKNEFGLLTTSFNSLAEHIQMNTNLNESAANLAGVMLSEYEIKKFFQSTLNALAGHTGSQMAAIYLLSDDKKSFNHFESAGVDGNARQSFAADRFEGEFGAVLTTRKVHHLKRISKDTRFVFHTVSGKFIPREIITIPILADNEVVAIISLASISTYSQQSILLIERILITLSARVEGILAYHKMKGFSAALEQQNRELEARKTELASQSAELTEQNSELEMQKEQLGEASRLKTNFLSNMSHELRTPLNSVIALSGVLNRRLASQIPEEEYSYLEVIERNGKHLLSLINDILDISRIESGQVEVEITKFNVNHLISELVSMIEPQADEKNIKLKCNNCDDKIYINSDEGKCRHILQNLVANAVKFTEKGKVGITTLQKENNIVISVKDTGIGISEDHLHHIFDEFRQADGSTSRKFGGTGLGLAIAKKYATLLGGTISVTSAPGKGSEFMLVLPLRNTAENPVTETKTTNKFNQTNHKLNPIPASDISGKTILLVEDSEPAIIQMKDILEGIGYQTLIARDGGEALKTIDNSLPDAIILDLMMPGIDGFEVLKTLREVEKTAHVPVLILTAKHITKEELKFLKRNKVHQLIQKGDVKRDELLNAVNTMVFPEKIKVETEKSPMKLQTIEGKPKVLIVEDNTDNMIT